jgi:hypothetical protein
VSKKKKTVNKLSDLQIDEVSLVDRGANQHASVVLSKRDEDSEEVDKISPDPSAVHIDGTEEDVEDDEKEVGKGFFSRLVEKFMSAESTTAHNGEGMIGDMSDVEKAFPGQDPRLAMFGGQQPPPPAPQHPPFQMGAPAPGPQNAMPGAQGFPAGPGELAGQVQAGPPLPQEIVQYIQQLEQALAEAQGQNNQPSDHEEDENVNPFGKSLDELDGDELGFLQELSKNLEDEDQREQIAKALELVEKANERAEQAEQVAKAEREYRLNQEWIAKAQAYSHLPVSPEEFGPVLKKLSDALSDEELDMVTKALAASSEFVGTSFEEIGKRGIAGYESVSKVDGMATELAKSENISKEQAVERVLEDHPELYDEYLEQAGR